MSVAARIHRLRRLQLVRENERPAEPIDPRLVARLRRRLIEEGHEQLASSIEGLCVVERCDCGQAGCQSFYTVSERQAQWLWRKGGRTIALEPCLSIDVAEGAIIAVEVVEPGGNPDNDHDDNDQD